MSVRPDFFETTFTIPTLPAIAAVFLVYAFEAGGAPAAIGWRLQE